jgi:antitoxin component YwqK of YwqJK toxin-antitoxin module
MSDSTNNITRDKYGEYHSYDDKPARIDEYGNKYWYIHGKQKRENIESPFIECSNGNKYYRLEDGYKIISYDQNGVMTQLNTYYESGNKKDIEYYENGVLSKKDGPARIKYFENGNICYEEYFLNGSPYKKDGPTQTQYHENGNIKIEMYSNKYGECHREDGPAYIEYYENGDIERKQFWENGKKKLFSRFYSLFDKEKNPLTENKEENTGQPKIK